MTHQVKSQTLAFLVTGLILLGGPSCDGNPVARTRAECETRESPLSGSETDIWMGMGGAAGLSVSEAISSYDGTYASDFEWIVDSADPKTTTVAISVVPNGQATLHETLPADEPHCAAAGVGFPAIIGIATDDGRLDELLEGRAYIDEDFHLSVHHRTSLGALQGQLAELFPGADEQDEVLFIITILNQEISGSITVSTRDDSDLGDGVGSRGQFMAGQFPIGGP